MENTKLSKNEMKKVLGGASGLMESNCSTTCKDGSSVSITDCNGTCVATYQVSVICVEQPSKNKYCPGCEPTAPK
jgi:hypothetical protein